MIAITLIIMPCAHSTGPLSVFVRAFVLFIIYVPAIQKCNIYFKSAHGKYINYQILHLMNCLGVEGQHFKMKGQYWGLKNCLAIYLFLKY